MRTDSYRQFATVLEVVDNGHMLHVFGDADLCEAEDFAAAIDQAAADGDPVLVNLTKCRYIDSSGLSVLIRASKRYGTQLRLLIAEDSIIARIVRLTSLDGIIPTSFEDASVQAAAVRRLRAMSAVRVVR
jgi:anti-anti-sigma factor